jgi:diacylglycerol kinase family enzyme
VAFCRCKSRSDGLKMILETQAGKHENSPLFDMVRVGAIIIEPYGNTTNLSVDGEKVLNERLTLEVHRRLLTFVCAE